MSSSNTNSHPSPRTASKPSIASPKVIQLGNLIPKSKFPNPQRGRIYSPYGVSPSLNGIGGGGFLEPKILITYE